MYVEQPPGYVKKGQENQVQNEECNSISTPTEVGLKLTKNGTGMKVDATLYKKIVGRLMSLTSTRPDIIHAVNLISRYMENPREDHHLAAKRIFRYLRGTADFGILYENGGKSRLIGFSDSDYAGDPVIERLHPDLCF